MADIAVTASNINPAFCMSARTRNYVANAAITAGKAVYIVAATGKVDLAGANASGKHQCIGVALETVGAGQTVSVLEQGETPGFDLSGLNYGDPVYLSDTLGALGTVAGTAAVPVGRVHPLPQVHQTTKILYVFCAPNVVQP